MDSDTMSRTILDTLAHHVHAKDARISPRTLNQSICSIATGLLQHVAVAVRGHASKLADFS